MLKELVDHDWGQVFGGAGEEGHENNKEPEAVHGDAVSTAKFTRENVLAIVAMVDGAPDEANWEGIFLLDDG